MAINDRSILKLLEYEKEQITGQNLYYDWEVLQYGYIIISMRKDKKIKSL